MRLQQIVAFLQGDRENFLSLHWRSPLQKMQTAASGVNQPLSKHQGGNAHQSPNKGFIPRWTKYFFKNIFCSKPKQKRWWLGENRTTRSLIRHLEEWQKFVKFEFLKSAFLKSGKWSGDSLSFNFAQETFFSFQFSFFAVQFKREF